MRERMKTSGIFYDSANLKDFKKWHNAGILGGATTNPVILQKEGILDLPAHVDKMIDISGKGFPISIEIPDSTWSAEEQVELALKYRDRFPDNAVIKVPIDPREAEKAFEVMHKLAQEGVNLNATVGLSAGQLIGASEAMRGSKAIGDNYISLFWGRCDEAGGIGAEKTLLTTIKYLETHSLASKIIIGSIRSPDQISEAFELGADIVTIPPKLIDEWMHTDRAVETIEQFNEAYRSVADKMKLI